MVSQALRLQSLTTNRRLHLGSAHSMLFCLLPRVIMSSNSYLSSKFSRSRCIQSSVCCLKCLHSMFCSFCTWYCSCLILLTQFWQCFFHDTYVAEGLQPNFVVQLNTFYIHVSEGLAASIHRVSCIRFTVGNVKDKYVTFAYKDASVLVGYQMYEQNSR